MILDGIIELKKLTEKPCLQSLAMPTAEEYNMSIGMKLHKNCWRESAEKKYQNSRYDVTLQILFNLSKINYFKLY